MSIQPLHPFGQAVLDDDFDAALALLAGLACAVELGVTELEVVSDSELMVKQMRGEYRVKNEALRALFVEASGLARSLQTVEYRHVKRAHNELADRLVNEALDAA